MINQTNFLMLSHTHSTIPFHINHHNILNTQQLSLTCIIFLCQTHHYSLFTYIFTYIFITSHPTHFVLHTPHTHTLSHGCHYTKSQTQQSSFTCTLILLLKQYYTLSHKQQFISHSPYFYFHTLP